MPTDYSDYDYSNELIRPMHNAPHLNEDLQLVDSTFHLPNEYILTIIPICGFVMAIAFIVWVILLVASVWILNTKYTYFVKGRCLQSGRAIFFTILIVCVLISFASMYKSFIGLEMFNDNAQLLVQQFKSLNVLIDELVKIEEFTRDALYGVCSQVLPSSILPKYKLFTENLISNSKTFKMKLEEFSIEKFIETSKNTQITYSIIFYSVFSFEVLVVLILVVTTYALPDYSYQDMYKITFILLVSFGLIAILVISMLLFLVILAADFCVDPVGSILSFLEPPKSSNTFNAYSITDYYLNCPPNSKSQSFVSSSLLGQSKSEIAILQSFVSTTGKFYALVDPGAASCMSALDTSLANASVILNEIEKQIGCSKINNIIQAGVFDGFCSQFYVGTFFSWVFQLLLLVAAYAFAAFLIILLYKKIKMKRDQVVAEESPYPEYSSSSDAISELYVEAAVKKGDVRKNSDFPHNSPPISPSSMEMTSIHKQK